MANLPRIRGSAAALATRLPTVRSAISADRLLGEELMDKLEP
jgi:hypothetical protein